MRKHRFPKIFLIFVLLSLISVYFLAPGFFDEISLPTHADNYIAIGILMHNMEALSGVHLSSLYHFPIFYPYSYTLTAGVNFFGQSLLLLPFYLAGIKNIYLLYNLMLLAALVLGGFSVYVLTRDIIKDEILSIAAGAVYIFLPMKQINYPHPAILFFPLSILAVFFLLRYLRESRRTDCVIFYLFLFLQALFSLSLFFLTSVYCVVLFILFLLIKRRIAFRTIGELSLGLILLAVVIFAVFYPYVSNPLDISYQKQKLGKPVLVSSIDFYSSWFPLTLKFLRGHPAPLYLGVMVSFLIFFFFFSKTRRTAYKTANYALLILLVIPVFFVFWRVIPLENLYKLLDMLIVWVIVIFILNTALVWKKISISEKVILGGIIFVFINYFKALFRFIPFKYNFLNAVSILLPQINRLKGEWKLRYYFVFLWILLAFLGFNALAKKINKKTLKTVLVTAVIVILLLENFPPPIRTGPLLEYNPSVKNLYSEIKRYPDNYGVLELPHYRGGWNDLKIYSLMTVFHDKHVYNGYYGVGVYDTLDIFKRGYFHPAENISRDITDEEIITYLRDNGIRIIVFHKSMLVVGDISGEDKSEKTQQLNKTWSEVISGFKKAKQEGLLSRVDVLPEGIVGIISEKKQGKSFKYQLPYYSLKSKKHIRLDVEKKNEKIVDISVKFNGDLLLEDALEETRAQLVIKVPPKKSLNPRGNQLEIKASEEILVKDINVHD